MTHFPAALGAARGMSQFRMLASNDGTTFAPVETASLGTDYTPLMETQAFLVTATFATDTLLSIFDLRQLAQQSSARVFKKLMR